MGTAGICRAGTRLSSDGATQTREERPVPSYDPGYTAGRVARHARWLRTEGAARLVEEDRLDPRERLGVAARKAAWRWATGCPRGTAMPVWVVGVQRSGTNMVLRGLEDAPEVEVCNENDRRAFHRFRLRDDARVAEVINASRHDIIVLKPLCDSHRLPQLLDALPVRRPARAIWVYRDVDARARSALRKFGDANLVALRAVAAYPEQPALWQAGGLSRERLDELRSFDLSRMSPVTAAALFWYLRNALFFDLALHCRDDVLLVSYEAMLAGPEAETRRLAEFLGLRWRPALCHHVDGTRPRPASLLAVDPRVRERCNDLTAELERARRGRAAPVC